jgi:hypothetical protein
MKLKIFIIIFIISCTAKDQYPKSQTQKDINFLLGLANYRDSGNCMRIEKQNGITENYCSRLPLGLCNSNLEIYTEAERRKRLSEISKILDTHHICKNLVGISGILTEKVTNEEEKQNLLAKKTWQSIQSCEAENFPTTPPLFSKEEVLFLLSNRGKLGITLENYQNLQPNPFTPSYLISEAKTCLEEVYTQQEKEILSQNKLNQKLIWIKK